MTDCTNCGKRVREDDELCPYCEHNMAFDPLNRSKSSDEIDSGDAIPVEYRSPLVAALFALILGLPGIWGMGHVYLGRIRRGIILLFLGVATMLLSVIFLYPVIVFSVILILQTYDAHRLAKEFNRAVEEKGRTPW